MDTQLPRLPLGISDFSVLREEGPNYLYVDKTERILDLLNAGKYLFLAHVFGVPLSPGQTLSFMVTVLLINFTELGLPRGGVPFRTIPAYVAAGIPIEGLVILQVANDLEDYPDTVANATGMFAAATALSRNDRVGA